MTTPSPLPAGSDLTPARPAGPPVTVEQVVDQDTYSVQVRLAPTPDLVTRLCRDLDGRSGKRALVAHVSPDNPEHQRALAELCVILADTFTVTLTPRQAAITESALYYATGEPNRCEVEHCESFATVVVHGDNLCNSHARALDMVDLWDREPS